MDDRNIFLEEMAQLTGRYEVEDLEEEEVLPAQRGATIRGRGWQHLAGERCVSSMPQPLTRSKND